MRVLSLKFVKEIGDIEHTLNQWERAFFQVRGNDTFTGPILSHILALA